MLSLPAHHSPCLLVQHTRSSMGYSSRPCSGNSPDTVMPGASCRRASNRSSTSSSSRLGWVSGSLRSAFGPARGLIAGSLTTPLCAGALMLDPVHGVSSCSALLDFRSTRHSRAAKKVHQKWFTDRCSPQVFVSINSLPPTLCLPKWHIEAIKFYVLSLTATRKGRNLDK